MSESVFFAALTSVTDTMTVTRGGVKTALAYLCEDRGAGKLAQYCNCIVTRGGVYNEILPEGFPEGSGNISLYTLTRVTVQSFSIT